MYKRQVIINSLGVVLMLYSGTGISAISSVPYAFSEVFPKITLGTFTSVSYTHLDVYKRQALSLAIALASAALE